MGSTMRSIAQALPLTHVTDSIRNPWLGLGTGTAHLGVVALILVCSVLGWRRAMQL
jgi:ABC-2 type transport system permease protein